MDKTYKRFVFCTIFFVMLSILSGAILAIVFSEIKYFILGGLFSSLLCSLGGLLLGLLSRIN